MTGLRFAEMENWEGFKSEFDFSIKENEFHRKEGEEVVRFDLVRQIFLDRGL